MKWLSIKKDGLPKEQGHYLVATPGSFPKNYRGQICEFYEDNKTFYSEYDESISDATHYVKLEDPPTISKKIEGKLSSGLCDDCENCKLVQVGDGVNEPIHEYFFCKPNDIEINPQPESVQVKECDQYKKKP